LAIIIIYYWIKLPDHGHALGSGLAVNRATDYLGENPGGILGAGLLVDPSLPGGQAAKSCIIAMVMMCLLLDVLSTKQAC